MALNPNPIGKAIADYFIAQKPADGTSITSAELETIWQGVMTLIYNDLKASLGVLPGTFQINASTIIAPSGGGACSGTAVVTGIGGPAQ